MTAGYFFINLDREVDRCALMLRSATNLGLRFDRISACDLATLSTKPPNEYLPFKFSNERWALRPFETAVFESHRKAWKAFLSTDNPFGVIMEDDILFSRNFADEMNAITGSGFDFDVLKINHSIQTRRMGPPQVLAGGLSVRMIYENIADAGCYMLTRKAAEALLSQSQTYSSHLDDFVFSPDRNLKTFQLIPPNCAQLIYFDSEHQAPNISISTRLKIKENIPKGPLTFRIWKELRRLTKRSRIRLRSSLNGTEAIDLAALLSDFKPIKTEHDERTT